MPKKSTILERMQKQGNKNSSKSKGVVAVLSNKMEIAEALDQGFTRKEIHSQMVKDGKMPVSYNAFSRLVNIYIKNKEPEENTDKRDKENIENETVGIAKEVFDTVFATNIETRSTPYKQGVLAALKNSVGEGEYHFANPYEKGTAESDAWLSGQRIGYLQWYFYCEKHIQPEVFSNIKVKNKK